MENVSRIDVEAPLISQNEPMDNAIDAPLRDEHEPMDSAIDAPSREDLSSEDEVYPSIKKEGGTFLFDLFNTHDMINKMESTLSMDSVPNRTNYVHLTKQFNERVKNSLPSSRSLAQTMEQGPNGVIFAVNDHMPMNMWDAMLMISKRGQNYDEPPIGNEFAAACKNIWVPSTVTKRFNRVRVVTPIQTLIWALRYDLSGLITIIKLSKLHVETEEVIEMLESDQKNLILVASPPDLLFEQVPINVVEHPEFLYKDFKHTIGDNMQYLIVPKLFNHERMKATSWKQLAEKDCLFDTIRIPNLSKKTAKLMTSKEAEIGYSRSLPSYNFHNSKRNVFNTFLKLYKQIIVPLEWIEFCENNTNAYIDWNYNKIKKELVTYFQYKPEGVVALKYFTAIYKLKERLYAEYVLLLTVQRVHSSHCYDEEILNYPDIMEADELEEGDTLAQKFIRMVKLPQTTFSSTITSFIKQLITNKFSKIARMTTNFVKIFTSAYVFIRLCLSKFKRENADVIVMSGINLIAHFKELLELIQDSNVLNMLSIIIGYIKGLYEKIMDKYASGTNEDEERGTSVYFLKSTGKMENSDGEGYKDFIARSEEQSKKEPPKFDEMESSNLPVFVVKLLTMSVLAMTRAAGKDVPATLIHNLATSKRDFEILQEGTSDFIYDLTGWDADGKHALKEFVIDLIAEGDKLRARLPQHMSYVHLRKLDNWLERALIVKRDHKNMCTEVLVKLYLELQTKRKSHVQNMNIRSATQTPFNVVLTGGPAVGKTKFKDFLNDNILAALKQENTPAFNISGTGNYFNQCMGEKIAFWDEAFASNQSGAEEKQKATFLNKVTTGGYVNMPTAGLEGKEQSAQFWAVILITNIKPDSIALDMKKVSMEAFKSRFLWVDVSDPLVDPTKKRDNYEHRKADFTHLNLRYYRTIDNEKTGTQCSPMQLVNMIVDGVIENNKEFQRMKTSPIVVQPRDYTMIHPDMMEGSTDKHVTYVYGKPGVGKSSIFMDDALRVSQVIGKEVVDVPCAEWLVDQMVHNKSKLMIEPKLYKIEDINLNDKEVQVKFHNFYNIVHQESSFLIVSNFAPPSIWNYFTGKMGIGVYERMNLYVPGLKRRLFTGPLCRLLEHDGTGLWDAHTGKRWFVGDTFIDWKMNLAGFTTHTDRPPAFLDEYADLDVDVSRVPISKMIEELGKAKVSPRMVGVWMIQLPKLATSNNPINYMVNMLNHNFPHINDLAIRVVCNKGTVHIQGKDIYIQGNMSDGTLSFSDNKAWIHTNAGLQIEITEQMFEEYREARFDPKIPVHAYVYMTLKTWEDCQTKEWNGLKCFFGPTASQKRLMAIRRNNEANKRRRLKKLGYAMIAISGVVTVFSLGLSYYIAAKKINDLVYITTRITGKCKDEEEFDEFEKMTPVKNAVKLRYGNKVYCSSSDADMQTIKHMREALAKNISNVQVVDKGRKYQVAFDSKGESYFAEYVPGKEWTVYLKDEMETQIMDLPTSTKNLDAIAEQTVTVIAHGTSCGLAITDKIVAVPYHTIMEHSQALLCGTQISGNYTGKVIYKNPTRELVLLRICKDDKPTQLSNTRDLTSKFLTEKQHAKVKRVTITKSCPFGNHRYFEHDYTFHKTFEAIDTVDEGGNAWNTNIGYAHFGLTTSPLGRGKCGNPYLYVANQNSEEPTAYILGIHAVYRKMDQVVGCVPLTVEFWNEIMEELRPEVESENTLIEHIRGSELMDTYYPNRFLNKIAWKSETNKKPDFNPKGPNYQAEGIIDNYTPIDANVCKNRIELGENSVQQEFRASEKVAVHTKKYIERHLQDTIPADAEGNKFAYYIRMEPAERNTMTGSTFLNECKQNAAQLGKHWATKVGRKLDILTLEEAIKGTEDVDALKLETSSSAAIQMIFPGKSLKSHFIDPSTREWRDERDAQWMKNFTLQQWEYAKQGKILSLPCIGALKAEFLRKPGRKRLYSVVPLPVVINMRRFLKVLQDAFVAMGVKSPFLVALNVFVQWHPLIEDLIKIGDTFIDLDFKNFDMTVPYEVIMACEDFMLPFFAHTKEEKQVIGNIFRTFLHYSALTLWVIEKTIISKQGGIPSGIYGTSMLDGICLYTMVYMSYKRIFKVPSNKNFSLDFVTNLNVKTCGDDCLISLSDEIKEEVKYSSLKVFFDGISMTVTPSTKNDRLLEHTPIEEMTFVSRFTRKLPGYNVYIPMLKHESIASALNWTAYSDPENILQGLLNSRIELIYSREFYEQLQRDIARYATKHGLDFTPIPFEDAAEELHQSIRGSKIAIPNFQEYLNTLITMEPKTVLKYEEPREETSLQPEFKQEILDMTDAQLLEVVRDSGDSNTKMVPLRVGGNLFISPDPYAKETFTNLAQRYNNVNWKEVQHCYGRKLSWVVLWNYGLELALTKTTTARAVLTYTNGLHNEKFVKEILKENDTMESDGNGIPTHRIVQNAPAPVAPENLHNVTITGQVSNVQSMSSLGTDASLLYNFGYMADIKAEAYVLKQVANIEIPTGTSEDSTIATMEISPWNQAFNSTHANIYAQQHGYAMFERVVKIQQQGSGPILGTGAVFHVPAAEANRLGRNGWRLNELMSFEVARFSFDTSGEASFILKPTRTSGFAFSKQEYETESVKPWTDETKKTSGVLVFKTITSVTSTMPKETRVVWTVSSGFTPATEFWSVEFNQVLDDKPPELTLTGRRLFLDGRNRLAPIYEVGPTGQAWNQGTWNYMAFDRNPAGTTWNTGPEVAPIDRTLILARGYVTDTQANDFHDGFDDYRIAGNTPLSANVTQGLFRGFRILEHNKIVYDGLKLDETNACTHYRNDSGSKSMDQANVNTSENVTVDLTFDSNGIYRHPNGEQRKSLVIREISAILRPLIGSIRNKRNQEPLRLSGTVRCTQGYEDDSGIPSDYIGVRFSDETVPVPVVGSAVKGMTTYLSKTLMEDWKAARSWLQRHPGKSYSVRIEEAGRRIIEVLVNNAGLFTRLQNLDEYQVRNAAFIEGTVQTIVVHNNDWPNLAKADPLDMTSRRESPFGYAYCDMDGKLKIETPISLTEMISNKVLAELKDKAETKEESKDVMEASIVAGSIIGGALSGIGSAVSGAANASASLKMNKLNNETAKLLQQKRLEVYQRLGNSQMATQIKQAQINQDTLEDTTRMNNKTSLELLRERMSFNRLVQMRHVNDAANLSQGSVAGVDMPSVGEAHTINAGGDFKRFGTGLSLIHI